ncbi:MAG TPA: hypothetical protein VFJ82_02850 [Longimicrobium sp.]|nr:hypothetical protein [Longimicrobium sp.]
MTRGALLASAALLLAACTPASSASTQGGGATLRAACGPADEPSVLLEVPATAAEFPRFRLRVSSPVGEVAGKTIEVRDPDAAGPYADWCTASECRVVRSATPTVAVFGPMRADSSVAVRLRTTTVDGRPFTWSGVAVWKSQTLLCG